MSPSTRVDDLEYVEGAGQHVVPHVTGNVVGQIVEVENLDGDRALVANPSADQITCSSATAGRPGATGCVKRPLGRRIEEERRLRRNVEVLPAEALRQVGTRGARREPLSPAREEGGSS
jgi:hypothetical protein